MTRLLTICGLLAFALTAAIVPEQAKAYESDTHFDMMYHLSRTSGINDSLSKFFALANQHIDEGAISSPMLLSIQRQLFHFPGELSKVEIEGHGAINLPSRIFKSKLALAERNSAIGNYLVYLGLSRGDLMLLGLGMHIKMDTYGHAGHSNLLGHIEAGHNPDRAFLETKKYEDMIRSMLQTLVAVKKLLPAAALDEVSALKYLNQFAPKTHLARQLTTADLQDPTIISGVMLADSELQGIYREDMFRKFEYKKLALQKIYDKFKHSGVINAQIAFEDLFSEDLLRDYRLDTKDTLKHVIVTTADAEFLKSEGGKEIFDLQKLFGFKSEELFHKKFDTEAARAEFRLRELKHMEDTLAADEASVETHALKLKKDRIEEEKLQLLKGTGLSAQFEYGSEEFIKARAREFAEERNAEEIVIKLVKDLVPMERTEYIKQNFEGNTETRNFEKEYKATAHRLYRVKQWGVNFVHGKDPLRLMARLTDAIWNFKAFIFKNTSSSKRNEWSESAQKAAAEYINLDGKLGALADAQVIDFNGRNKLDAFLKLGRYVGPGITPWLFGHLSGFRYVQKLLVKAKNVAKDHEVEDMELAKKEGKYKNLFTSKKSKNAVNFINQLQKTAISFRCEGLF
ncbi:MAG: hypothetical protein H7256_15925 [Bdellovibrio sp.]|nr:hypothetical protein [Bdellovibrio sp.]